MGRVYDPNDESWRPVERRGAVQVTSHLLLPVERGGRTRLSLTRIAAGGTFGPHIDDYEHVFVVLRGEGEVMVAKERRKIAPGDVITTGVGEPHGLWATKDDELVLVTSNVYPAGEPGDG
jgi:quercetin dioxygenase-like cupin family protein